MKVTRRHQFAESQVEQLRKIVGEKNVLTDSHDLLIRAAVPSPFPLHRWKDFAPDVVVLPRTRDEIVEIVRLANRHKLPIVSRGGGTGLADGAVPLRKGILLDLKRMNSIIEIDEENQCVTVEPGLNMHELNKVIRRRGFWYPDDPSSYFFAVVGGRLGTSGWSLISGISGHARDLIISMEMVLPSGEVVNIGDGGGKKIRKASVGYSLKNLFIGAMGTLGVATRLTLEMFPRCEAEFAAFFGYESFDKAYRNLRGFNRSGLRTMASIVVCDEKKMEWLRRDNEGYLMQPENVRSLLGTICYGAEREVQGASERIFEIAKQGDGMYLGRELSEEDWAARHDSYAGHTLRGRNKHGEVVPFAWHCEDNAILYSELPYVTKKYHEIVGKYQEKYDGVFEDWGVFYYNSNPNKPWGDYLVEIDIGVNEWEFNDQTWKAWVSMKRAISEVAIERNGSISAAHGGTRQGDVELLPREMGGGQFTLMKDIKKHLDPNNIMNPGKYLLDQAYVKKRR